MKSAQLFRFIWFNMLLIFMFTGFHLKAQNFTAFTDTAKIWSVLYSYDDGENWNQYTRTYIFSGDTVIEGVQYKKLYAATDPAALQWNVHGAMRQDGHQVFYYNFSEESEQMIYDFSLIPGDTLTTVTFGPFNCAVILESVDTVTLLNNEERERFVFVLENTNDCIDFGFIDIWLEGIGSTKGLIPNYIQQQLICCSEEDVLLCITENDTLKYQNGFYNTCYLSNVRIHGFSSVPMMQVFPNPAADKLNYIHKDAEEFSYFHILNSDGKAVLSFSHPESRQIDVSGLPSGMYILEANTRSGKTFRTRFVKM
jgi:hypothetical protein